MAGIFNWFRKSKNNNQDSHNSENGREGKLPIQENPEKADMRKVEEPSEMQLAIRKAFDQIMAIERGESFRVSLNKPEDYQDGLCRVDIEESLSILSDRDNPFHIYVSTADGELVGELPRKGKFIEALRSGLVLVRATVTTIREPNYDNPLYRASVQVDCVSQDDSALFDLQNKSEASAQKSYSVHIVGEQHYQDAIQKVQVGDHVALWHEPDNPYDAQAIAVSRENGDTLGYLPRDSWLHRVLLDEKKGYDARVDQVGVGTRGFMEIRLSVTLSGNPINARKYHAD